MTPQTGIQDEGSVRNEYNQTISYKTPPQEKSKIYQKPMRTRSIRISKPLSTYINEIT